MSLPSQADILDRLSHLSGLSPAVQAILPRLDDDELSSAELGHLLSQDPLLAARILRLANSPFYGLARQVGSLQEAVLVLGFSNLRGLVLSVGVIGAFEDHGNTTRSLATAAAAAALAKPLGHEVGQAFTAGLLHNLGDLLLHHFAPTQRQACPPLIEECLADRLAWEQDTFGFDHCTLGAEVASHWRFPTAIQAAIRHYPCPPDDPPVFLADLVHVAWSHAHGKPLGIAPEPRSGTLRRLGLEGADGVRIMARAAQAAASISTGALH